MDVEQTLNEQFAIENSQNYELYSKNEKLPNLNVKESEEFRMHFYFKQPSPRNKKRIISPYESYNITSVLKSISNEYNTYKKIIQQVNKQPKFAINSQKLKFTNAKQSEEFQSYRHESLEGSLNNLQHNNMNKIKEYLRVYNVNSSKLSNSRINLGANKSYNTQNTKTNSTIDRMSQMLNYQTNASIVSQEADQVCIENEYFQLRQNFKMQTENDDMKTLNQNEQQQENRKYQVSTENCQKLNKSEIYSKLRSFSSINSKNPSEFQEDNIFKTNRRDAQNRNIENRKNTHKLKFINKDDVLLKKEILIQKDDRQTDQSEEKVYNSQENKHINHTTNQIIHLPIIEHNSHNEETQEENSKRIEHLKKQDTLLVNMNKRNSLIKTQETPKNKYHEYIGDYNIESKQQASKGTFCASESKKKSIDQKISKKQLKNIENQVNENNISQEYQPKQKKSEGDIRRLSYDGDIVHYSIKNSLQKQIIQIEKKNNFMKINSKDMPEDPNNFLEFKAQKEIEKQKIKINKEQIFLLEKKKEEFQKLIQQQQNQIPQNKSDRKNVHSSMQYRSEHRQKNPRQIYSRISDANLGDQLSTKNQQISPLQQINNINKLLDSLDAKKEKLHADINQQTSSPNKKISKSDKKQLNILDQSQKNIQKKSKKSKQYEFQKNDASITTLNNEKNENEIKNENNETLEHNLSAQATNESKHLQELKEIKQLSFQEESTNCAKLNNKIESLEIKQNQPVKNNISNEDSPNKFQPQKNRQDNQFQLENKSICSIQNDSANAQQKQANNSVITEKQLFTQQYERRVLKDRNKNQKSYSVRQSQEECLNQENLKQIRRQQKFQQIMEYDTQKKFTEISKIIDRMTKSRDYKFKKSKDKDFKGKQVTFQLTESQLNSD
ncbi:hypothetical protein TTHERM_00338270 (macronuclear) [Tetrahymena thermophila SB210]|uniref:Uncharacterized protein n=1 Tax=Tetrahymena thermophila (strain SB210) TaxID=312017 RepID=I7M881_TETTS|nr:hypothetical protein TTHERM_00338270 [Tetrahymena thermophila SB210]EAR97346.2 hypothetical protein TTHERM_00338270 [Tetrahymena thermophila SB210]|eukprot:XP_001017591.2 hypothetical protein TTHERM_00338270 [Tetrahymena thermophila SB210]